MGRPKTGDRVALAASSGQVSRRTLFYARKVSSSPLLSGAIDAGKIAVHHAAFLADFDNETQAWALEASDRKDVLERVKALRIALAEENGQPSPGLDRLLKAWSKASADDRQAFVAWIVATASPANRPSQTLT